MSALNINTLAGPNKAKGARPLPKAGTQAARIVHVVDLGVQARAAFKGQERAPKRMVWINFELVNDKADFKGEGKLEPHRISPRDFAVSTDSKAAITKLLSSLDPENTFAGDLTKLVNLPCLVVIVYNKYKNPDGTETTFANINQVSPVPQGFAVPELSGSSNFFSFDEPDAEVYQTLPKFIQDKIVGALNYGGSAAEKMVKSLENTTPQY